MPEEAEAGAASAAPLYEDLVPRDCLVYSALGQIDPEYHVLAFVFEESEPIPIILVSEVNSQLLVAIPGAAWHRTSRLRKLPPQSLSKVQAVAALAVPEGDRQVSSEGIYIKIWLGLLKPEFEECLDLTAALASPAFPTETGAEGFLPYAQSLVTLADDKYSFVSAESAVPQEEVGHRLLTLEENLKQMAESMQQFMSQYQDQGSSSSFVKATSKAAPKPAAPPDLSGLDPQVLRGALHAGVPRSQLEEFAKLIGGRKPKMSDVPGLKNPHLSKTDVLGETDEDEEPEESGLVAASPEELNDPVKAALLKLTKIVDVLASSSKKKTKAILEDGLDDSGVWSEGASSSTSLGGQGRRHAALLQTLQKAFREAPQDIYAVLEAHVRRFWLARTGAGSTFSIRYLPGMGRTSQQNPEFWPYRSCDLGSLWSSRCFEERSCAGGANEVDFVVGATGPGLNRPWAMGVGRRRFAGAAPTFFLLFSSLSAGLLGAAAHAAVASGLGRSGDVASERVGRFCGAAIKARPKEFSQVSGTGRGEKSEPEAERKREGKAKAAGHSEAGGDCDWRRRPVLVDPAPELCNESLHASKGSLRESSNHCRPPGSQASTVSVDRWWNSSFRFVMKHGGSFGSFVKSMHRKSVMPRDEATASLWPMPLPYPAAVSKVCSLEGAAETTRFQKAVNLTVAALNWLTVQRANTCPSSICLFRPLNRRQWRCIRQIEATMEAWRLCEPVTSEAMGSGAAKVEELEKIIDKLAAFEDSVRGDLEVGLSAGPSGQPLFAKNSYFAPGLRRSSPGDACGKLSSSLSVVAKSVEADRLDFKGRPDFDPRPYLDPVTRFVYEAPLEAAMKPEELDAGPPRVRVHASRDEVWKLLKKLDQTGRLGVVRHRDLVRGHQAGLFSLVKDQTRDRLIVDCRPFNSLECPPNKFISSMASGPSLCDFQLAADEVCLTSGTDLREFYYSFRVGPQRVVRNALLISAWPDEIREFSCYCPSLEIETKPLHFSLATLGMGDTCAVEVAQTSHIGLLCQLGITDENVMLSMNLPIPRSPYACGVVIDDLVLFERVALAQCPVDVEDLQSCRCLESALDRYKQVGLLPHEGKTFRAEENAEFWGALFEGRRGFVRSNLKREWCQFFL